MSLACEEYVAKWILIFCRWRFHKMVDEINTLDVFEKIFYEVNGKMLA